MSPSEARAVLYVRDYHLRTVAGAPQGLSRSQYRDFFGVCYLDWSRDQRSGGTARQRRRTRLVRIQAWRRADNKAYEAWANEVVRKTTAYVQEFVNQMQDFGRTLGESADAWHDAIDALQTVMPEDLDAYADWAMLLAPGQTGIPVSAGILGCPEVSRG